MGKTDMMKFYFEPTNIIIASHSNNDISEINVTDYYTIWNQLMVKRHFM